jgi:stringent starvation protein B
VKSPRPYLIKALIDWIVDNNCTPYVAVAADVDGVQVPPDYVDGGKIVLNISANAIRNFEIVDEVMLFDSRFSGSPFRVVVPTGAVVAVFAKESARGMAFEVERKDEVKGDDSPSNGPSLKIVK